MEETAEMSHGEILGESGLWQKLNRALMTCSQSQQWLTTEPGFSFFWPSEKWRAGELLIWPVSASSDHTWGSRVMNVWDLTTGNGKSIYVQAKCTFGKCFSHRSQTTAYVNFCTLGQTCLIDVIRPAVLIHHKTTWTKALTLKDNVTSISWMPVHLLVLAKFLTVRGRNSKQDN